MDQDQQKRIDKAVSRACHVIYGSAEEVESRSPAEVFEDIASALELSESAFVNMEQMLVHALGVLAFREGPCFHCGKSKPEMDRCIELSSQEGQRCLRQIDIENHARVVGEKGPIENAHEECAHAAGWDTAETSHD